MVKKESKSVKVKLNGIRVSARKTGLVVALIRGQSLEEAQRRMKFSSKSVAKNVLKLLKSAEKSAKDAGLTENLMIKEAYVGKGTTLKRFKAGSRGTALPIKKRTSNITILVERN